MAEKDVTAIGKMKLSNQSEALNPEDMLQEDDGAGMETSKEFDEIDNVINSVKQDFMQGNLNKVSAIKEIISSLHQLMPSSNLGKQGRNPEVKHLGRRMYGRKGEMPYQSFDETAGEQ